MAQQIDPQQLQQMAASAGHRDARRMTAASDWAAVAMQQQEQKHQQQKQQRQQQQQQQPAQMTEQQKNPDKWILPYPTQDINEVYIIGAQIGQPGQFGRAHLVQHRVTGAKRAVKVVSKQKFTRSSDKQVHFKELKLEIDILRTLEHDNIITLYDVYETVNDLYLVTELCGGGELFDRIKAQPAGSYSEKDAQVVLRQICTGLAYLHKHKIAHCDLKPDNFLFTDPAPDARLKIIDFGMSKHVRRRQYLHSLRGTPYYIAPEVLRGQYNEACDMWSFGVVMFVMLFGYPPFHADADQEIFRKILNGFTPQVRRGYQAHFPAAIPCSDSAKDLIAKLLTSDTAKRLTAEEALAHPWLSGDTATAAPMINDVLTNLRNFAAHSKFKQGILNLMVNTLNETDIQRLQQTFKELDADGNGQITISELSAAVEKSGLYASSLGSPREGQSKLTQEDLKRILEAVDVDGDGTISYNELLLTTVQRKISAKEERLWMAFSRLDCNRDGKITVDELAAVFGENRAEAEKMIKSVDKDGDNVVNFDEFLDLWITHEIDEQTQGVKAAVQTQNVPDLPPGAARNAKQ